jgi:hypothetical protein
MHNQSFRDPEVKQYLAHLGTYQLLNQSKLFAVLGRLPSLKLTSTMFPQLTVPNACLIATQLFMNQQ